MKIDRKDLRCKVQINPSHTDREIFVNMENNDHWLDGNMPSILIYLSENRHLNIPTTWHRTMTDYLGTVREAVLQLKYFRHKL